MTGPSFCWQCRKKLSPNRATGELIFAEVVDPLGHKHRVHKTCVSDANRDQRAEWVPPVKQGIPDAET